jgi:TrmH family RNA methyltransferase
MPITSLTNPRVKDIAALATKKQREETGLFLVEGLQLVGFGVAAGWPLETLIVRADWESGARSEVLMNDARNVASFVLDVDAAVMHKLSNKDNPPTVMGVFGQRPQALKKVKLEATSVWLVLEEPRDPGNVGTIIRSADALGASGVIIIPPATDVWAPECVRATMGSIFHVPVVKASRNDVLEWVEAQRMLHPQLILAGLHLAGSSGIQALANVAGPRVLAFGTEQTGLSPELTAACTQLVKIPMVGKAESLNLAQAATITLYEVRRSA